MEKYKNNICIVGKDIKIIQKELNLVKEDQIDKIENFWNVILCDWKDVIEKIKSYNIGLKIEKFSLTIIFSLDDLNNKEKEKINNLMRGLDENLEEDIISDYKFPFIIFLVQNEQDENDLKNEFLQYTNIDKRNISYFISPLKNDSSKEKNKNLIKNKIFKIFSYYYELGDEFLIGKNNTIKLYENSHEDLFPVNVLVIGRTQVGKSTFINTILKEKRAKEGDDSSNETEKLLTYHIDGVPLLLYDIEGFTGEKNINNIVKKIESMQISFEEKELHLIIYILRYDKGPYFNTNEYEIFKQLSKNHHMSHFLFVCTKSKENVKNQKKEFKSIKESFFKMIKKGIEEECKDEKNKFINTLNYLYYCQKKEIYYNEVDQKIKKKDFNKMEFYQRMELKFRDKNEEDKINEMLDTIIEKDKTVIFVNLKEDEEHANLFGMDKLCSRIIEILTDNKSINMKILNNELDNNEIKIYDLKEKMQKKKMRMKVF